MLGKNSLMLVAIAISALLHGAAWLLLKTSYHAGQENFALVRIERVVKASGKKPQNPTRTAKDEDLNKTLAVQSQSTSDDSGNEETELINGANIGVRVNYPRISRLMGEEGRVIVQVTASREIHLATSSGFARLDQAALDASRTGLAQGRFNELLTRQTVASVEFIFRLTE